MKLKDANELLITQKDFKSHIVQMKHCVPLILKVNKKL